MRVLLHMCCGPCAIMPLRELAEQGHEVTGWFFNPNIHPLTEYLRRRDGAAQVADKHGIRLLFPSEFPEYDPETWCREALDHGGGRCAYCRESRFMVTAAFARERGFDAFTSSLLYSRRQNHEGMREAGLLAQDAHSVRFLYADFRSRWQEGIAASKEMGIYRQQYCGCLFSEGERYARDLAAVVANSEAASA